MKGTEKQIKWAEDIQNIVVTIIDNMLAATANDPRANTDAAKAARAKFRRARDAVATCDDAHDLIEVYEGVSSRRSERDNMMAVTAKISNRFKVEYGTAAQRALIGE